MLNQKMVFIKKFFIWYYMIYVIFDSTFNMSKHRMQFMIHLLKRFFTDWFCPDVEYKIHIENQLCEYDIRKIFRCKIKQDMNHYLSRCEPFWPDYFCLPSSEFKTAVAKNNFLEFYPEIQFFYKYIHICLQIFKTRRDWLSH